MSADTTFLNVERITVNPVETRLHFQSASRLFSVQRLVVHFKDGGEHALTLFLNPGQNALALGDVVTHEVTA
jgi:hypothetical protein